MDEENKVKRTMKMKVSGKRKTMNEVDGKHHGTTREKQKRNERLREDGWTDWGVISKIRDCRGEEVHDRAIWTRILSNIDPHIKVIIRWIGRSFGANSRSEDRTERIRTVITLVTCSRLPKMDLHVRICLKSTTMSLITQLHSFHSAFL